MLSNWQIRASDMNTITPWIATHLSRFAVPIDHFLTERIQGAQPYGIEMPNWLAIVRCIRSTV